MVDISHYSLKAVSLLVSCFVGVSVDVADLKSSAVTWQAGALDSNPKLIYICSVHLAKCYGHG